MSSVGSPLTSDPVLLAQMLAAYQGQAQQQQNQQQGAMNQQLAQLGYGGMQGNAIPTQGPQMPQPPQPQPIPPPPGS